MFSFPKHNLLLVKINKIYKDNMSDEDLYNAVRGLWRAISNNLPKIDYVLGLYKC